MTAFIEANFRMMDGDGDDLVSKNEFRYNCISRVAVDDVKIIDDAFEKLLNVSINYFCRYRRRLKLNYESKF